MKTNPTTACITGISGQDGIILGDYLLDLGYDVVGFTRNLENARTRLGLLAKKKKLHLIQTNYAIESLRPVLKDSAPSVIFNLAGQSFVSKSWELLEETIESQGTLTGKLLEAVRNTELNNIKFINATSSEIFDVDVAPPYSETSNVAPYNPYGCAQLLSFNLARVYRRRYSMNVSNVILFPHESIYRHKDFFMLRVLKEIYDIKLGRRSVLDVGNLHISRDWGYAPEFMQGVFSVSKLNDPDDFIFSTGTAFSVEEIIVFAAKILDVNLRGILNVREDLKRYYEPRISFGNYTKAKMKLGWQPNLSGYRLVRKLYDDLHVGNFKQ